MQVSYSVLTKPHELNSKLIKIFLIFTNMHPYAHKYAKLSQLNGAGTDMAIFPNLLFYFLLANVQ